MKNKREWTQKGIRLSVISHMIRAVALASVCDDPTDGLDAIQRAIDIARETIHGALGDRDWDELPKAGGA